MNWQIISIIGLAVIVVVVGIFLVLHTKNKKPKSAAKKVVKEEDVDQAQLIKEDTEKVFNNEFREELRNRGRLHFEKIITENAMFLQQDLQLTTSQLNDYMKNEIKDVLKSEFSNYEESISRAKDLALDSINKTQVIIENQRVNMEAQVKIEADAEKQRIIEHFEKNMATIVNHYILSAIGNEIDLSDQLDYIFQNLQDNKKAIIEDINSGA